VILLAFAVSANAPLKERILAHFLLPSEPNVYSRASLLYNGRKGLLVGLCYLVLGGLLLPTLSLLKATLKISTNHAISVPPYEAISVPPYEAISMPRQSAKPKSAKQQQIRP
jgi:hypothetical protein